MNNILRMPSFMVDDTKDDIPKSTFRTTNSEKGSVTPASMGGNIIRLVEDFSAIEIDELGTEINQLELKIRRAQLKQEYIKKLRSIADEYKEQSKALESEY